MTNARRKERENIARFLLGISGGVSFFTYLPTTPSLIVRRSLFLRDSMFTAGLDRQMTRCQTREELTSKNVVR